MLTDAIIAHWAIVEMRRCFKMGYVQYDELGQVTLIAASPNHSLLKCVIENLESKTSLVDPDSIWPFLLDHFTTDFAMDMDKSQGRNKMSITSRGTFDTCRNTKLATLDRKSTRLNSSHRNTSRMPSSA